VAIVLVAATWAAYGAQVAALSDRATAEAYQRTAQLANAYQSDVSATISLVDNLLRFLGAYEAQNGAARTAHLVASERLFSGLLGNVAIVDARGSGFAVGPMGLAPIELAGSGNVRAANGWNGLVIGAPLIARVTKHLAVPFVRSVRRADGSPAGFVTAVIDVRAFTFGYGSRDIGPNGVVELVGLADRVIRARIVGDRSASLVGRRLSGTSPMFVRMRTVPNGSYRVVSRIDGMLRVFSYRKVPGYPLAALAGLAAADIAAGTAAIRHTMLLTAWGATLVILVVLGLWLQQQAIRRQLRVLQKEATAASHAKSDFLASMSHEIRTPMNGVIGLTNLALETNEPDVQRDYLQKIDYSAKSLLAILNDILDFSKIEAGKLELETVRFGVRTVLDNLSYACSEQARVKGLRYGVTVDPSVPAVLEGDPVRYGQIVLNLVTNAIKFTAQGSVEVAVRAEPRDGDEVALFTTVRDTGIGISAEDRSRLFLSFSQADSSISRRFGGTGLGLAICKALVEKMGGSIGVESEPGNGSTFAFRIMLRKCDDLRLETRSRAPEDEADRVAGSRVLVADDNDINRHIVGRLLARLDVTADFVTNGREALDAVRADPDRFDLVLMDVEMPEMDGLEATRHIREGAALRDLPIVAMTAHAMEQERRLCEEAGMNDHLTKPIDPKLLAQILRRHIRQ
jgi:signal transduction histidine kinase/ActR/RegA family two-component response regulator